MPHHYFPYSVVSEHMQNLLTLWPKSNIVKYDNIFFRCSYLALQNSYYVLFCKLQILTVTQFRVKVNKFCNKKYMNTQRQQNAKCGHCWQHLKALIEIGSFCRTSWRILSSSTAMRGSQKSWAHLCFWGVSCKPFP